MAAYMKKRRSNRLLEMKQRLGGKCVKCGSVKSLEFDHIDPSTKFSTITKAQLLDGPLENLITEVDKCQLLCSPCHKLKTRLNREITSGGQNKILNPKHGTQVMYGREKCRCFKCKEWKRLYRKGLVDCRGALLAGAPAR